MKNFLRKLTAKGWVGDLLFHASVAGILFVLLAIVSSGVFDTADEAKVALANSGEDFFCWVAGTYR